MSAGLTKPQVVPLAGPSTPKNTAIFIQNACLQHRYIRSKDTSAIVERPERLRAVSIGLSAAIARLEELFQPKTAPDATSTKPESDPDDLVAVMNKLNLGTTPTQSMKAPVTIVQSNATVNMMNHPGVKFVHGDIERDVYLENLNTWIKESVDKIAKGESEIPQGYAQGDLYLCPGSLNAIQGAVGTVCEAVDRVMSPSDPNDLESHLHRAFVSIRPPGHHCGEDTPSGFCFLNNVAIAAAHAHLNHGIKRVVIFDIDLHHGNGTQSIVWQINEESYRQTLESEAAEGEAPTAAAKTGPEIYYGSIHDILSYPCEDGKLELIQAASVSIHKSHGQHIENIHLQTYTSEDHFWDVLYKEQYSKLLVKAREFLDHTGGPGDDAMVFISCGMDACEHEYESMSRHNRKVPASFYHRFARDACALADKYSKGRLISVLEGGYSDRALISGAMAHLCGLVDVPTTLAVDEQWWNVDNLVKLENATKKRRGGRPSLPAQGTTETWLERALTIFAPLDGAATQATASTPRANVPIPPTSMTLRDRTKGKNPTPGSSPSSKPPASSASAPVARGKPKPTNAETEKKGPSDLPGQTSTGSSPLSSPNLSEDEMSPAPKKLPRVVLKLGKAPEITH